MVFSLRPLQADFAAEVRGLDLSRPVARPTLRHVLDALIAHQLLIVKEQHVTPGQQIAFSQSIGRLHVHVHQHPEHPEITILGNPRDDATACWHTDGFARTTAPLVSVLYAREVPREGGDTLFVDAYEAYETLPHEMQRTVEGCEMIHEGNIHPMVRIHPVTQRAALHCGLQIYKGEIVGKGSREKEQLIRELIAHVERCVRRYRHEWQLGDMLVWDNTAILHKGTPIDPGASRVLHRTLAMWETANSTCGPAIGRD